MSDLKGQIRTFIESNFLVQSMQAVKDDDSLLDLQIVDSTGFLELIHFVEATFGIAVAEPEMVLENFETIDRITCFVTRKLGTGPAAGN